MIRTATALILATVAAPALATSYVAQPVAPATQKIVARDVVWACGAAACTGSTQEGRPAIVCQSLAKKVGRLESFAVNGRAFAPADLDRCNAAAKTVGSSDVAASGN